MPTLGGKQTGKLNDALDDAFDSVDILDDFLWEMLDKRLHNLAIASDARTLRSKLIRKADSQGWVLDLIAAACQGQRRKPQPVRRLVADPDYLAAQRRVLGPQH